MPITLFSDSLIIYPNFASGRWKNNEKRIGMGTLRIFFLAANAGL